jgi:hypothetical protein
MGELRSPLKIETLNIRRKFRILCMDSCCLCLEPLLSRSETLVTFPCGHRLHFGCNCKLISNKILVCPLCRRDLKGTTGIPFKGRDVINEFETIIRTKKLHNSKHVERALEMIAECEAEDREREHYREELLKYVLDHKVILQTNMTIFVRLPSGKFTTCSYHPQFLVGHIMLFIEERWNIPLETQRVFFKGIELCPARTLNESGIERDRTLTIDVCPK